MKVKELIEQLSRFSDELQERDIEFYSSNYEGTCVIDIIYIDDDGSVILAGHTEREEGK